MTNESLANIGDSLRNVAGAIAERLRQADSGATPPFTFFDECLDLEGRRLCAEGQDELADALAAFGEAINA